MALDSETLQSTLYTLFSSMNDGLSKTFANGIAGAVVTFVSTGTVNTVDAGTVTGGTFAGKGKGTLTVTPTELAKTLISACNKMNGITEDEDTEYGDDFLAEQIGKGLKQMADNGKVNTTVKGTLTAPNGATSAMSGNAQGSIKCDSTYLVKALKSLFKDMYDNREDKSYDGNMEFAKKLASEIKTFFTSGIITTDGLVNLEGSKGSGNLS